MIDIPAEWELAKAMPAGGCGKCETCTCKAKPPTAEDAARIQEALERAQREKQ